MPRVDCDSFTHARAYRWRRLYLTHPLLTRDQAAEYLGIKPQTLAVWATTHRYDLPFIKVGRSVRYRVSDLDAFLEQRTVSGGSADSATLPRPSHRRGLWVAFYQFRDGGIQL